MRGVKTVFQGASVNVLWKAEVTGVVIQRVARGKEGKARVAQPLGRPVQMRLVREGANGTTRTSIQIDMGGWVDVQFPDKPERAATLLNKMEHVAVRGDMPEEFGRAVIVSNTDGLAIVVYVLAEADGTAKGFITAKTVLSDGAFIGVECGFATFQRADGTKMCVTPEVGMVRLKRAFHDVGDHYVHSAPSGTVVLAFDSTQSGLPHTPQQMLPQRDRRPSANDWGMADPRPARILPA